ncbi:MAG: methylmalonyl Co-A mutase-associated GTPase MeaB [Deltaproteobacteria bacterium]|nr:MAG: methylmalonyl Co-A mutase-associated GTPase MeaB [Deltaproteobacteria bacterium]
MADDFSAGVLAGDKAAVAAALNLVEDRRPEAREKVSTLLDALARAPGRIGGAGHRIGITGPPGVGKSTLCAALGRQLRAAGRRVGVVAVDPSSVRSGGALLGDRTRMTFDPADDGFFVRSLSTGGEAGGLSWAANAAVRVLGAAYDVVLVETTGVGQTETDIVNVADTVVFVVQPGSGDALQFLKAGIMEIPDIFVVNKSDLGGLADRALSDLSAALHALGAAGVGDGATPVLAVSSVDGKGFDALMAALDQHAGTLGFDGIAARRAQGARAWVRRLLMRRYGELGIATLGGFPDLDARIAAELSGGSSPPAIAATLGAEIEQALRLGTV